MIRMMDLAGQYQKLKPEIDEAVGRVLASGRYILGPEVESFEAELAAYVGSRYAVGFGSGTDALLAAALALDLPQDTTYITTPFTFIATVQPAMWLGWKIWFVDINPETYCMRRDLQNPSPMEILNAPMVVVPVHLYGKVAEDRPPLATSQSGVYWFIIEDAAQALGATCNGRKAGTFGDIGCFSFFPTKNLGCAGDGGACVTDSEEYAKRLRQIRIQGADGKYHHVRAGLNMRLDELQAAILRVKLPYLEEWNGKRINLARTYASSLGVVEGIKHPSFKIPVNPSTGEVLEHTHVFHQYTIRVLDGKRDALAAHLKAQGIETAVHYPTPLHLQPVVQRYRLGPAYENSGWAMGIPEGFNEGMFPESERAAREVLSLPIHEGLKAEEVEQVCEAVKGFYRKEGG